MAPLRDAVGLVDDEQADSGPPEGEDELKGAQALRGDVEHLDLPGPDLPFDLPALLRPEPGVKGRRPLDRTLEQGIYLVFHQRDERRDDYCKALAHERRHLVAEALPTAGRHHGQSIPPFEDGLYYILLPGSKRVEAEDLLEHV